MRSLLVASVLALALPAQAGDVVLGAGDPAPTFEGEWIGYQANDLADLQGRLVFVEFWRTW